jgi:outer membrane protein assembly factor BamB
VARSRISEGSQRVAPSDVPAPGDGRTPFGGGCAALGADALAFLEQADSGIFALKPPGEDGLTTNHDAWRHRKGVASVCSPLFYRGRIYVAQDGGRVTCFDAQTGDKHYEQERMSAGGDYFASPVAANGHIYFCSGKVTVTVAAAGDTLQVTARNTLGEPIYATPAIVDDRLYVRSQHQLWAFGGK